MSVIFHNNEVKLTLPNKRKLKLFLTELFEKEGKNLVSLTYIFCSDEYLLGINQLFLQHNYYTDIITFDISTTKQAIEGEVYISVDRVKDNAKDFKQSFQQELHRVIFHGALHLCGYKDKTKKDEQKMREMENLYLSKYFKLIGLNKNHRSTWNDKVF